MNRKKVQITKEFAGRLVLNAQLLDGRIKLTDGKEGISQTIDQLGYIQIDNLIIQRERIKRLFGFDYAVECYVPAVKRRYGYFVLPILWGDRFVGRLDPKADRKKKVLIVRNLVFEPEFMAYDAFLPLLVNKLIELARFNDCERVIFEKVSPEEKRKPLESLCLKNAI